MTAFTRHDVDFPSGDTFCAAWLYVPEGLGAPAPVIILGHGLGATREMRLDAFAERFAQAGFAVLAFTYRHFGDSGGSPRQLLSIKRQLVDWDAAIAHVKARGDVDGSRIAVWGSSFGGGHAITVAARHPELARKYGADRPFALVLRIVEPTAYGADFTELVADVSDLAFQPAPLPAE